MELNYKHLKNYYLDEAIVRNKGDDWAYKNLIDLKICKSWRGYHIIKNRRIKENEK